MKKDKRPLICVCLSCYGQMPSAFFMKFIYTLHKWNEQDMRIKVIMNAAIPIDKSRNALVEAAKKVEADYVFFMDTDIILPENALMELIDTKKDIVSGVYFTKGAPYRPVIRKELDGRYFFWDEPISPHQIIKIAGSGMGCCLIKTSVFSKLEFPYFKFEWEKWRGVEGQGAEDLYFCKKARKAGFEIYANTNVICGHIGGVINYDHHLMFQPAVARLKKDKDELVKDIMDWTDSKDKFEVLAKLKKGVNLMSEEWNKAGPKTPKEIKEFYMTCKSYMYDLGNWHMGVRRNHDDKLVADIMKLNPKSVLDFGCGIAQNAIMIKKYAKIERVVAADLKSNTLDFARFRAVNNGYTIEFWETNIEGEFPLNNKFDAILCFDVLEHLSDDEFKRVISMLKMMKHDDTKFYISVTFGKSAAHPMHKNGPEWKLKLIKSLVA